MDIKFGTRKDCVRLKKAGGLEEFIKKYIYGGPSSIALSIYLALVGELCPCYLV